MMTVRRQTRFVCKRLSTTWDDDDVVGDAVCWEGQGGHIEYIIIYETRHAKRKRREVARNAGGDRKIQKKE